MAELSAAGLLATKASPNPPHMGLDDLARLPYLACVCKVRLSMHALTRACIAATRNLFNSDACCVSPHAALGVNAKLVQLGVCRMEGKCHGHDDESGKTLDILACFPRPQGEQPWHGRRRRCASSRWRRRARRATPSARSPWAATPFRRARCCWCHSTLCTAATSSGRMTSGRCAPAHALAGWDGVG